MGADGKCPKGTRACSGKTSTENTVCEAKKEACPVTDIKFVTWVNDTFLSEYEVSSVVGYNGFRIATSKVVDSMPIVDTTLEF